MKAILAIVLLGLVSNTLAFTSMRKIPSIVIDTSFLKTAETVKKPSFAQLTTVMQQLRDVSQVTDFLNNLLKSIAENRVEKLAIIEQTRAQCSEEEAFREEAILEGERGAAAAQNQLNLCTGQKAQAVHLNELAANALEVDQNELADLNEARAAQERLFQDKVKALETLQANIRTLEGLLDAYEAESTGALTSSLFIQTTNKLLKSAITTDHSHVILPMYTKLLQMHSRQSTADELAEIRQILNEITESAANSIEKLNEEEADNKARYEASRDRLQALINRLSSQVAATQAFSALMDQCIAQETSINELSEDKVQRNQDLLASSQALCSASEEEWRLSELSRAREVNVINALLGAVKRIEADYEQEEGPKVEDLINVKML